MGKFGGIAICDDLLNFTANKSYHYILWLCSANLTCNVHKNKLIYELLQKFL